MTDVLTGPVDPVTGPTSQASPASPAFPPDETGPPAPARWWTLAGAAVLLPLVLFLVLQPETYGLTPNGLDPIFYTGLGMNFDDAVPNAVNHYFITRWPAWYPLLIADTLAGPTVGRLLLRLALVAGVLFGLWRLRPSWSWSQRLLAGTVLVTTPMFVRPLMTDYVEYILVVGGLALVLVSLGPDPGPRRAIAAGTLAGALVATNPLALPATVPPLAVLILLQTRGIGRRAGLAVVVAASAVAVLVVSLLWFRWVHGIPNIYQPTINFIRSDPVPDQMKSPRLEWLGAFTWVYVPLLLAAVAVLTQLRSTRKLDRVDVLALGMALAQYGLQWVDQFVRDGTGLELSYYWSLSFPTLGVALALLVGRLAGSIRPAWAAAATAGWIGLLVVGVPDGLRLPAGIGFAAVALAVLAAFGGTVRRFPVPALAGVVVFVGWTQIGAPRYDPSAYHPFNNSPRYDRLFWSDGNEAEAVLSELVWFDEQLEPLAEESRAAFFETGGTSFLTPALFHAHISGRLISFDDDSGGLRPLDQARLASAYYPYLVVLGTPDEVASTTARLTDILRLEAPQLDVTHDGGLGSRLVVFDLPEMPALPITIDAADLPLLAGIISGAEVAVEAGAAPGIVTFGPYLMLPPGRFTAVVSYRAAAPRGEQVGELDVNSRDGGQHAVTALTGTGGATATVELPFTVDAMHDLWEFRTSTNGSADLVIEDITLDWG